MPSVLKSPLEYAPRLKAQVWRLTFQGKDNKIRHVPFVKPQAQSPEPWGFFITLKIIIIKGFPSLLTKRIKFTKPKCKIYWI